MTHESRPGPARGPSTPVPQMCPGRYKDRQGTSATGHRYSSLSSLGLLLSLVAVACGCRSPSGGRLAQEPPCFSELEVRSKIWRDQQGQPVHFLEWSVLHLGGRGELMVAKYGSDDTRATTCLDFYRVIHRGEGLVAVAPLSPKPPPHPILQPVADKEYFDLLIHDYRPEAVMSIDVDQRSGKVLITVTRETVPAGSTLRRALRYTLVYTGGGVMYRNARLETSDLMPVSQPEAK